MNTRALNLSTMQHDVIPSRDRWFAEGCKGNSGRFNPDLKAGGLNSKIESTASTLFVFIGPSPTSDGQSWMYFKNPQNFFTFRCFPIDNFKWLCFYYFTHTYIHIHAYMTYPSISKKNFFEQSFIAVRNEIFCFKNVIRWSNKER